MQPRDDDLEPRSQPEARAVQPVQRRWLAGALALGSLSVLSAARLLTPAASGLGTHTQLGLPPCGFFVLFGKPCPACGLTTAFAHLAHGSLWASLRAHPLGLPLFVSTLLLFVLSLRALLQGGAGRARQPEAAPLPAALLLRAAVGLCLAMLLVWIVRLL